MKEIQTSLLNGLNNIVKKLARKKCVQIKKNNTPYCNKDLDDSLAQDQAKMRTARETGYHEDKGAAKNMENIHTRILRK